MIPAMTPIERRIFLVRGYKVMFDVDLARIYGVSTKRLNEQVRRNYGRFPSDFMFKLTMSEVLSMRSHFATASNQTSVQVVRAFVHLREMIIASKELGRRLDLLEKKYDGQFKTVFDAIRLLMPPSKERSRKIGFRLE